MGKRVAILQSSYVPWKGYFDIIGLVDEFILLDNVQYTPRDWRNRNRIKTANGLRWLSVPVNHTRESRIADVAIAADQGDWAGRHWRTIEQSYAAAPALPRYRDLLARAYARAGGLTTLSAVNELFLRELCAALGITTLLSPTTDYLPLDSMDAMEASERLAEICRAAGATRYLSGPAAQAYLDPGAFRHAGVSVDWMDYSGYPPYPQLHGEFVHEVSVLDLLLMEGEDAPGFMKWAAAARVSP